MRIVLKNPDGKYRCYFSRRINRRHQLVYSIRESEKIIKIVSMKLFLSLPHAAGERGGLGHLPHPELPQPGPAHLHVPKENRAEPEGPGHHHDGPYRNVLTT